ncbi:MAG: metal ABC transporter permease [Candidatus Abawacabacteria bacterium]|nr:metal ABC transporter permease [Candidatus Abawacabacteria bacterium]
MSNFFSIFDLPFMMRALLAGCLVALLTSQLGVLVISRKLAFLGDTLSHAAFTGIAIGIALGINLNLTVFLLAVIIAFVLTWLQDKSSLSSDTYIALLYSSLLAFGIVIVSHSQGLRAELFQYLFGDILAVSFTDIIIMASVVIISILLLIICYRPLLMITIDQDLAHSQGVKVKIYNYLFTLLLALATAITIKLIGVLLLSALLIIPAAIALTIARSLKQTLILSLLSAELMAIIGIFVSYLYDLPTGPTIILIGTGFFVLINVLKRLSWKTGQ